MEPRPLPSGLNVPGSSRAFTGSASSIPRPPRVPPYEAPVYHEEPQEYIEIGTPPKKGVSGAIIALIIIVILLIVIGVGILIYFLTRPKAQTPSAPVVAKLNESCATLTCIVGTECVNGVCKSTLNNVCNADSDCCCNLSCSQQQCKEPIGGPCQVNADCAHGLVCGPAMTCIV